MKTAEITITGIKDSDARYAIAVDSVQSISGELFVKSTPLNHFEQAILNQSFKKALKFSPSRVKIIPFKK